MGRKLSDTLDKLYIGCHLVMLLEFARARQGTGFINFFKAVN